ncbi:MerC domain-containing protein [Archangium violaceum]|uniref:MerC domain-containing protein n=1 Tax=Archangium violaceum TaxID=83451 RepID=UPI00194E8426|nr:MerC domain-containing protein [Archangium violaceum]QRN97542.1 MerC domain-containing protein [Archangium violaceum]
MSHELPARGQEKTFPGVGRWDAWGQGLSLLCMAHCLLLPLVLGLLPAMMGRALEEAPIHLAMVMLATVVGGVSFVTGFLQHRDWHVLTLGATGLGLLVLAQSVLHEGLAEMGVTLAGGIVLLVAHGLNRRRCQHCCSAALEQGR